MFDLDFEGFDEKEKKEKKKKSRNATVIIIASEWTRLNVVGHLRDPARFYNVAGSSYTLWPS